MLANASAMLMALTPTPSTFTRAGGSLSRAETSRWVTWRERSSPIPCRGAGGACGDQRAARHLLFDPRIRSGQPLFQRDLRLPTKNLPQRGVVWVSSAHALRARHMFLLDRVTGRVSHEVCESVDRDESVLPEIQRLVIVGPHQTEEAFDAVIDVTERPRLLTVSPDLHFPIARQLRDRDLSTHCGRCFFTTPIPGS